jgi:UDP-glucose 4-epimerase
MSKYDSLKGLKILITGGLGFIGSSIAQRLVSEGAHVTIYDACLDPYGWNFANIKEIKDDVQVVRADVRNADELDKYVRNKDIIFHLAAQVGREISMTNPALDIDINCNGTLNLIKSCASSANGGKVIYAGSRGQIGEPVYLPVDENHPTEPTDMYGINKLAAEKYLLLWGKVYGFPVTSLRLNNVYGPRCQMQNGYYGILNWFIKKAMLGEDIPVYGDGSQTRDYVYIDDVVEAFVQVALSPKTNGQSYFVGSAQETVFLDMVKAVITAVGKGRYVHVPFPPQRESIDIKRFVATYEKLKSTLGWQPKISFQQGLSRTVAFYQERLGEYI